MRPALRIVGSIARTSIVRNFEQGGRPKRWKPSLRVIKHGGQTLILSGRLKQSIAAREPRVTETSVTIGSNVIYAAIHHYGGVIEHGPSSRTLAFRRGKDGKLGGFMSRRDAGRRKTGAIDIRTASSGGGYTPIPARPFLLLQTEDMAEIKAALAEYIAGK